MPLRRTGYFLLLGLAGLCPGRAALAAVPTNFTSQTIVSGLDQPRAFAFLPDGRVLFIEQRSARVRMVVGGQVSAVDPILVVPSVNATGYERGMQAIAVDPRWPVRPFVYLFHNRDGGFNRLVRYTAGGPLTAPANDTLTLSSPRLLIDNIPDNDPNHQGGCLKFGPDSMLYVSLGEDEVPCAAADSTSLRGLILRLDVSKIGPGAGGQVPRGLILPAGNPLSTPDSNAKLAWAYGLRNPWSFGIDALTGALFVADVGEADFEELDEVLPGRNYGWPYREGPLVLPRSSCPEPGGAGNAANGYRPPIVSFSRPTSLTAIFSAGAYRPPAGGTASWPTEYWGDVFWGEYYGGYLRRIRSNGNGTWSPAPAAPGQPNASDWGTGFLYATDFNIGPDASLYWLQQFDDANFNDNTGSLRRIRYTGPSADSPRAGPERVTLSASPSPFVSSTELSFQLPAAGRVRLSVYDLTGRRIRALLDGELPAGTGRASWEGDDERGGPAAPGVYLARLERPGAVETVRILRLR